MEEGSNLSTSTMKKEVKKLIGKKIVAYKKNGDTVTGTLVKISGNQLIIRPSNRKKVQIKAILPLALFDLLAIGTSPFVGGYGGYGGYPYGYGHGYGYGYGVPPFGFF